MIKRNVAADLTKINLKDIVREDKVVIDLQKTVGKYGETVIIVFDDKTYVYAPSSDIDYLYQVLNDAESMEEIHAGYNVRPDVHTSKAGKEYYTVF